METGINFVLLKKEGHRWKSDTCALCDPKYQCGKETGSIASVSGGGSEKDAALKSRFLSNMSHDIRTPMNGIIGMIDLANHYPNDLEMQQKCRDQVLESSKHLVSLVSNILDMSKLESGDIIEQELDFDLTEVLSRANTDKQILAEEKILIMWWTGKRKFKACISGRKPGLFGATSDDSCG